MPSQISSDNDLSSMSLTASPGVAIIQRSHSLDGTTADVPTDQSGSVEEDEVLQDAGADQCDGHDHYEIPIIDEVINFHVDTVSDMIFGGHEFYKNFQRIKKTTKLVLADWSEINEDGDKTRTITYTIAMNHPVGPKSANTLEKQFWRGMLSKPGQNYVIDAECHTSGVPYSDNFYLINRFCINKISINSTQLKITSRIVYVKKVWGLVKSFIDKNVKSGTLESYTLIARLLQEEAENLSQHKSISSTPSPTTVTRQRKKVLKKKRSKSGLLEKDSWELDNVRDSSSRLRRRPRSHRCSRSRAHREKTQNLLFCRVRVDTLAQVVCVLLLMLAAIHFLLFYKLRTLEETALHISEAGRQIWGKARSAVPLKDTWKPLLDQQEHLQSLETDQWREILSTSAEIMDSMQRTLLNMETNMATGGHLGQTELSS